MKVSRSRTGRVGRNRPTSRSIYWGLWAPRDLFKAGEQGLWYDPSDLTDAKISWRRNLLLYSNDFAKSQWQKTGDITVAFQGEGSTLLTRSTTGYIAQQNAAYANAPIGTYFAFQIKVKQGVGFYGLRVQSTYPARVDMVVNLATGVVAYSGVNTGYTLLEASASALDAQGFYNLTLRGIVATTVLSQIVHGPAKSADASWEGTPAGSISAYVKEAQFELSTTASAYQPMTDFSTEFVTAFPMHSLYQDAAGTTAATALEQPVGLVIDKRLGAIRGAEVVLNGTFDTDLSGWVANAPSGASQALVNGSLELTTTASNGRTEQSRTVVAGIAYEVFVTVRSATVTARLGVIRGAAGAYAGLFVPSVTPIGQEQLVHGFFTATGTDIIIQLSTQGSGGVAYFDNISIKPVAGNHATQSTTTSRPLLSARVNKCLNYNANPTDLTGVTKTGEATATLTIVDDAVALAAAGLSAIATSGKVYKLDNSTGSVSAYAAIAGPTGNTNSHAASVWARASTGSAQAYFRSTQGDLVSTSSAAYTRLAWTNTPDLTNNVITVKALAGSVVYFILNQFEEGTTASSRIQLTTGSTYDATGWPRYLKFDGVDDWLNTVSAVDMTGSDKLSVFIGQRKAADAAQGVLLEFGAPSGVAGTWAVFAPLGASSVYGARSMGTTDLIMSTTPTNYSASRGVSDMLTFTADISAPKITLRVNAVQIVGTATQGTGNYGTQAIYIGRRAGSTQQFTGNIYSVIVREAASNDAQIANAERYTNKLMGLAA